MKKVTSQVITFRIPFKKKVKHFKLDSKKYILRNIKKSFLDTDETFNSSFTSNSYDYNHIIIVKNDFAFFIASFLSVCPSV